MITIYTIEDIGLDPESSGLSRFIPEEGLSAREFIRLPIEEVLDQVSESRPAGHLICDILFSVMSRSALHRVGIFAAREVLPIFERDFPGENLPGETLRAKEQALRGELDPNDTREPVLSLINSDWYDNRFEVNAIIYAAGRGRADRSAMDAVLAALRAELDEARRKGGKSFDQKAERRVEREFYEKIHLYLCDLWEEKQSS